MKKTFQTKTKRKVFLWHDGVTHRIKANVRGSVIRRSSSCPDEAVAIANRLVDDINKGIDPDTQLTTRQRCEYLQAIESLPKGSTLKDAIDFYNKHHTKDRPTIADLHPRIIASLKQGNRSEKRQGKVDQILREVSAIFKGPMDAITTEHLERYLAKYENPETRANRIQILSQIWSFAQKHGFVAYGVPLSTERLIRLPKELKDPVLCPIDLLKSYLQKTRDHDPMMLPFIAIAAFAGVRTSEITRLTWGDVDMEEGHIRLTSDITKTRRRRLAPMPANLREWLEPFHSKAKPTDPIAPSKPENVFRNLRKDHNLNVIPANSLRHTAATMFIASGQKIDNVAAWFGNSVAILEVYYKGLATQKEALEYFDIYPDTV